MSTMNQTPSLPRLRLISDEELEREFTAGGHDEATRQAILFEQLRRIRPGRATPGNTGLLWAILVVSTIGAVLAGVGAFPVLSEMFEREWFDF
jgi:hypothetical protein